MRINEFKPRTLVIFDIDDTLVHTQTKVHVVKDGQVTHSLNSHEFTHYKLQPGEEFDFGDFRDAREFFEKSKPIIPMINQLKRDIATGNKVVMVTARADFNDRELFLDTFRKYGVDMSKVHVYRAGNMHIKAQTEEKKKIIIRDLLGKELYTKAIMYDDAEPNLHAFISLKDEYPHTKFYAWHVSLDGEASEYHRTDESLAEDQDDYEIRNYKKLDGILAKLCKMVVEGQSSDKDYGMVAACVLDPDNQMVARLNYPGDEGKRVHAERAAIEAYESEYGDIPEGSIILTTLSPCNEHMDERDGPSCTDVINHSGVKKVYCGYTDPTQTDEHRDYNLMETSNERVRNLCKKFADTFLDDVSENFADGKHPGRKGLAKRSGVNCKASVSTLRNVAKHSSGEKQRMAHWCANMKSGKKK
jgi:pyrimidine deaminase RibD-like protein